ncbi:J domain-containing protein [Anaerococcus sp. ENR1011]|uniref:J domain-containing protein n=1 Tax=Anaerococcus groningensis TaxID=3115616 RepID=A0ABW9N1F5_9FIRM
MKFFGKILHGLATGLGTFFNALINIMNVIVVTFEGIRQLLFMIFIFGCSTIFIFPIIPLLLPKEVMYFIFAVIFIPILGPKFISFLRYINYTLTEWMYDRADSMITGQKVGYESLSDYSDKYIYEQEQMRRRQREEEARRQQEEMNRRFEEFVRNFGGYQNSRSYGSGYNTGYGQGQYSGYNGVNDLGFKDKYEQACKILGVGVDTDIYEVKLNYRKLAKKYHPDLNKDPDATTMFTKVNDAYEFLTEENIKKYKQNYL